MWKICRCGRHGTAERLKEGGEGAEEESFGASDRSVGGVVGGGEDVDGVGAEEGESRRSLGTALLTRRCFEAMEYQHVILGDQIIMSLASKENFCVWTSDSMEMWGDCAMVENYR